MVLCFLFISIRTAEFLQQYFTGGLPPASRWLSSGESELPADRVPASPMTVLNTVQSGGGRRRPSGQLWCTEYVGKVQSSAGTVRGVCDPASRASVCSPVCVPTACLRLAAGVSLDQASPSCGFQPGRGNMRVHAC